ncbi:two-component system response regulator YesN [Paenibacillus endophyticus]|uniref:Two-component system response regulator YesN n=1 Tax=Paenibacillus endophyticus TaxID=1294268 RepID=A0A7W5C3L8_9BACL|nr:helix-turn-helix domain-containing protein [Paenibacillus endophyticus]MBB3150471.1 two-component system response regulator YesN [Paenibacillus endophyticus]
MDDEEIITDGLYEILSKLPIDLDMYKAYSGEEALQWLRRTRFDIVLSDIAMPEMDGLALMDEIRSNWPHCKLIFLTGYHDFESMYQAIQWPGVRYLLKSEGYNKLIDAVGQAVLEIEEELRTADLLQRSKESQISLETLAIGNYVRHLLFEGGAGGAIAENFSRLNIPFDPVLPVLIALGSLSLAESRRSYADRQETALKVKLLADSYLGKRTRSLGIIDRYGDLVWLVQPLPSSEIKEIGFENTVSFLEGMFELIQDACKESLSVKLSVTMGAEETAWETLPKAYDKLREHEHLRAGDGTQMVQSVRLREAEAISRMRWRFPDEKAGMLTAHLEGGRRAEFYGLFDELTRPAIDGSWPSPYASELYYSIALALLSYSNRWNEQGQFPAGNFMQLDAFPSWQERFGSLKTAAMEMFDVREQGEQSRAITAVDKICAFIDEHIAEDLSLVRLADEIHLNPSYLSRLFKQERGVKLSEYIEDARFAKAKDRLRNTDSKIGEIGISVGYEAAHSFTRVFKKWSGMSPQEFREQAGMRKQTSNRI